MHDDDFLTSKLNSIKQFYVVLDQKDKIQKLNEILDINMPNRPMILVYVKSSSIAELLKEMLPKGPEIASEEDFDGKLFCDEKV